MRELYSPIVLFLREGSFQSMETGVTGLPGVPAVSLVRLAPKPELDSAAILRLQMVEQTVLALVQTRTAATLKLVPHLVS